MTSPGWIAPDWPAPPGVRAAATLRGGGVSPRPWDSLNLGAHVGDEAARVAENRQRLRDALSLPGEPAWLDQVHGRVVLTLDGPGLPGTREADAAVTRLPGRVLAVLTADCLPVLFCDRAGRRIGVAHAGWRGLAAGVLEAAVEAMAVPPGDLLAWIGPAIGAAAYEVGDEVREACLSTSPSCAGAGATKGMTPADCFRPTRPGHWQCDLTGLARLRLAALGIRSVHGGGWCTWADPARFFSHRRDGAGGPTGRMATLIWLEGSPAA